MHTIFESDDTDAVLLIDHSNVFNPLNRAAALHDFRVLCPIIIIIIIITIMIIIIKVMNVACPFDTRIAEKEREKIDHYQDLKLEIQRTRNCKS